MKKIIIILFTLFIPLFLCVGCVASDTEIANSLDGNMTRLVYSVGYLDSISQTEMADLIQNTSYFGGVDTLQNASVGLTSLRDNGFRTSVFNNSLAENCLNSNYSNNLTFPTNNFEQNENLGNNNYGIATLPLLDGEYPVADNLNSGNATQNELGGLYAENDLGLENEQNINLGGNYSNGINSGGNFGVSNSNNENIFGSSSSNYGNYASNCGNCNQCNNLTNNNGVIQGLTQNQLLGVTSESFEGVASNESGSASVSSVDTSLLLTSASDLNEILMLISQKRGIIMLYCTDLRAGKGTLTADEKEAITEYIAIIKETTNYLNTYSNTLTTYMNNIKTIAYTENAQELINAKLIRTNEILKTRYAKLDTCIDSLDAIISILQRAIGMDYVTNYAIQNNLSADTEAMQSLTPTENVNILNNTATNTTNETAGLGGVNANNLYGTIGNNLTTNETSGLNETNVINNTTGLNETNTNCGIGTFGNLSICPNCGNSVIANYSGESTKTNTNNLNNRNYTTLQNEIISENGNCGFNNCNQINNLNNLNSNCGTANLTGINNENEIRKNSSLNTAENNISPTPNCPFFNSSLLTNENLSTSNNINNNLESLTLSPSSNATTPNILPENNSSLLIDNTPNLTTEEILNGYPTTSPITTPNPTNIISSIETSANSFDTTDDFELENFGSTIEENNSLLNESVNNFENTLNNENFLDANLENETNDDDLPPARIVSVAPNIISDKSLQASVNLPIVKEQDTVKTLPYYPQFN